MKTLIAILALTATCMGSGGNVSEYPGDYTAPFENIKVHLNEYEALTMIANDLHWIRLYLEKKEHTKIENNNGD